MIAGSFEWSARIPGLDRRAIALFRIALGCVLLLDLLLFKFPNVADFYGPSGVFEHYYVAMAGARPLWANVFHGLPSDAAVYAWFAASAVVYALFTLGVRARLLALLAFLVYTATSLGNPAARTPDDLLFGFALFWALLLPVGDRLALSGGRRDTPDQLRSLPAWAALISIGLVYTAAGVTKLGGDWLEGEGLLWVLRFQMTSSVATDWLVDQPLLAELLNDLTLVWEITFLFLLFSPWASRWLRLGCALSLPLFHGLMLPFLFPGYFLATGTCFGLLLLPAFAFDSLGLKPAASSTVPLPRPAWHSTAEAVAAALALALVIQRAAFDLYVEFGEGLREGPIKQAAATLLEPVVSERNPLGVLQRRTVAYPMHSERYGYTVVPLGVTAAGRELNLLTGAAGRADVHLPVLWNRHYEAFLIDAWFGRINRVPYLKVKWGSMDRLLARMAADWNRSHPDARVESASFELFVFDLAASDRNAPITHESLVDWSASRGIKSREEIRREAEAIHRNSAN